VGVNGKNKGNSQERKIANLLSARFKDITKLEKSFIRNSDSGSYFGGSNQRRKETHDLTHAHFGDIICPDNFKFSIECKFYKSGPSFASIVKGEITQWDGWLKQASQDAENSKKEMLLIVKYNGIEEIIFLNQKLELPLLFVYKDKYNIYKLADMLTLPDGIFFTLPNEKN
jgi:hypothetical protein